MAYRQLLNEKRMKQTILTIIMLIGCVVASQAQRMGVYIADSDGAYTNVRNAPKGAVVAKIPTADNIMLNIESPQKGWWRVCDATYWNVEGDEVVMKGSETGYWIHHSVIGNSTRNYGGQRLSLRKLPSAQAAVVFSFTEELLLHPVDIKGDWVKVTDGKHTGWIESEWLCDNPVTNCC